MTTDVTGAQNAAAQTASAVSSTASDVSHAATTVDKTVVHQLRVEESALRLCDFQDRAAVGGV